MANETVCFFLGGMEHEHVKMLIIWNRDDLGDMIQKGGRSVEDFLAATRRLRSQREKLSSWRCGRWL